MKRMFVLIMTLIMLAGCAAAQETEMLIVLSSEGITVNGDVISEKEQEAVYLARKTEVHEDVPEELKELSNCVVTITRAGTYRVSGTAADTQIVVRAGENDRVKLILDGVNITCRTSSAIVGESAYDPRKPGEYGLTIELAEGTENFVTGSHTARIQEDDIKYDGAIDSLVSLGFEGSGSLTVDADKEGIEVKFGHMTINGGSFTIASCDDPLNVSEDEVGTLTVNDGYLYSAVKPEKGGEGDGIDSNGYIVLNGGTVINLAHPTSQDSGIDSDMGSSINGGLIVGAGNMYDPIDTETSSQLFMMLEFGQETDDLVVVTDENDVPVFACDFPYDYTYIAFSAPELTAGETYRVYLGGAIEGEAKNGLYTSITSYTPGKRMQHGGGTAEKRMQMGKTPVEQPGGMEQPPWGEGMQHPGGMAEMPPEWAGYQKALSKLDLNELLKDADLNQLLAGKDLNGLLTGFSLKDLMTEEQIAEIFGDLDVSRMGGFGGGRGMGGGMPRMLQSSADTATTDFALTFETTGFTNVVAAE